MVEKIESDKDGGGAGSMSIRSRFRRPNSIDTAAAEAEHDARKTSKSTNEAVTPKTDASTPSLYSTKTPQGVRGKSDLRSPGVKKTPLTENKTVAANPAESSEAPIPDFITQTDKYGRASTPRSGEAISAARVYAPSNREPNLVSKHTEDTVDEESGGIEIDACDTLLEGLRMMCCCLVPENGPDVDSHKHNHADDDTNHSNSQKRSQYSTRGPNAQIITSRNSIIDNEADRIKLLPKHHPEDIGKKCLVLDLDETLVHSSFRAVPEADFVIPVQIEDVVHFVYVCKRPGVDEFLIEMAKYYEVVIYTASLNKYADPLLDLLDPEKTIRTRLFRESCVYYEGNYVKDLSLLDRDLSQSIIVDNSPSSYIFHPENAIDCTSFIDDPEDRELDQIASFLKGVQNVNDVRNVCSMWREWPKIPNIEGVEFP